MCERNELIFFHITLSFSSSCIAQRLFTILLDSAGAGSSGAAELAEEAGTSGSAENVPPDSPRPFAPSASVLDSPLSTPEREDEEDHLSRDLLGQSLPGGFYNF